MASKFGNGEGEANVADQGGKKKEGSITPVDVEEFANVIAPLTATLSLIIDCLEKQGLKVLDKNSALYKMVYDTPEVHHLKSMAGWSPPPKSPSPKLLQEHEIDDSCGSPGPAKVIENGEDHEDSEVEEVEVAQEVDPLAMDTDPDPEITVLHHIDSSGIIKFTTNDEDKNESGHVSGQTGVQNVSNEVEITIYQTGASGIVMTPVLAELGIPILVNMGNSENSQGSVLTLNELDHMENMDTNANPSETETEPLNIPSSPSEAAKPSTSSSMASVYQLQSDANTNSPPADKTPKIFKCHFCPKLLTTDCRRKLHERMHTGDRPYKCRHCEKTFAQPGARLAHERARHTGEKPYACQFCDLKFPVSSSLKSHERGVHTGETPHECRFCDEKFSQPQKRNAHERKLHTKGNPHVCDHCQKPFKNSAELSKHVTMSCIKLQRLHRAPPAKLPPSPSPSGSGSSTQPKEVKDLP